eukprot:1191244-Prorocentrum_minimum.AAC.1
MLLIVITYLASASVLLVGAVESVSDVPPPFRRCFTHEIDVPPPDRDERAALLRRHLAAALRPPRKGPSEKSGAGSDQKSDAESDQNKSETEQLADQTSGYTRRDLQVRLGTFVYVTRQTLGLVGQQTLYASECGCPRTPMRGTLVWSHSTVCRHTGEKTPNLKIAQVDFYAFWEAV